MKNTACCPVSKRWMALAALISLCGLNGCSVFMAINQPDEKNVALLKPGTPRVLILGEFGAPLTSEMRNGQRFDVYSFVQGYGKGNRVGRAMFHGTADVLTAGLWEVVGTPTEAIVDGDRYILELEYDAKDHIVSVTPIKGKGAGLTQGIQAVSAPSSQPAAPAAPTTQAQTAP